MAAKNRIMIFGPQADGAYTVEFMSAHREVKARAKVGAVVMAAALILGGCTRDAATARLKNDIQPDTLEIVHARFPCRSPDIHFFGYRFRIFVKGQDLLGDICWDFSTREWTWQILPDFPPIASQLSQIVRYRSPTEAAAFRQLIGRRARRS